MDFDNFINKQLELIDLERTTEIDESKNLLSSCSLQRLQIKGICLLKLKIEQKYTGLYGRTILVFQTAVSGKTINTQHFSSGDIVSISENSLSPSQLNSTSMSATQKNSLTGTVTKVTSQSVSVAIDNEIENLADSIDDNETFKLIKLSNDITHKRLKSALNCLKGGNKLSGRTSHLVDILFYNLRPDRAALNSEKLDFWETFKFFNQNLDESQQQAVKFSFEQKDLAIIHGPPGTGKTTTLIEIIKQNCLKYNQKILCCAPSNIAVDNLVERLVPAESGFKRLKLIRLGHPARLLESIQDYCLDSVLNRSEQYALANDIKSEMDKTLKQLRKNNNQRDQREKFKFEMRELRKELYKREERAMKEVMKGADVILATLSTAHADGPLKHLDENHFDIIIIDECSQALEAACYIPLIKGARKLIIAGDHLQLPPTIISKEAAEKGLDLTLMKRLIDKYGDECTKMLTTQYRMNKLIMNWISLKLYDSRLIAHAKVAEHLLCDLAGVEKDENTSTALLLIDTHGCDYTEMVATADDGSNNDEDSKANDGEANLVCYHVSDLIRQGLKQDDIAVITPYNLQMELIKAKLHSKYAQVEVKSVDGFQGREKEAVIISLVRSNTRGEVGFLADERRINVAITRARRHLCVVCDAHTCRSNAFLKSFIDYCEENGSVRSAFEYENNAFSSDLQMTNENTSYDLGFDEIKFQKLKVVTNTAGSKKGSTKQHNKTPAEPRVFVETDEDMKFKEECCKPILDDLKSNKISVHRFPVDLTPRQRKIVHELAEQHKLYHASRNQEDKRYIMISTQPFVEIEKEVEKDADSVVERKPAISVEKKEENSVEEDEAAEATDEHEEGGGVGVKLSKNQLKKLQRKAKFEAEKEENKKFKEETFTEQNKFEEKRNNQTASAAASALLGELENQNDSDLKYRNDCKLCSSCGKFILKCNYLMHELHCSKMEQQKKQQQAAAVDDTVQSKSAATATNKKKDPPPLPSKLKKNPIEKADTDDFDELINMFQKTNNVCNFQGCKVKVSVLGSNCEFCKARFCLQHSLFEVHGCGDEAKKQARSYIRKTGNLNVNEKQATSYTQEIKHKYVEKKFHEKLDAMQAARTGADKKKQNKK